MRSAWGLMALLMLGCTSEHRLQAPDGHVIGALRKGMAMEFDIAAEGTSCTARAPLLPAGTVTVGHSSGFAQCRDGRLGYVTVHSTQLADRIYDGELQLGARRYAFSVLR